jgi:curved DNA-binding protein CbpA
MREQSDPYAELGVARDATPAEITRAFRDLLRRHHPDTRRPADAQSPSESDERLHRIIAAHAALATAREQAGQVPEPSRAVERPQQRSPAAADDTIRVGPIRWRASP